MITFSDKSHELDLMTQRNLEISEVDEDELLACVQGQLSKGSKDQVKSYTFLYSKTQFFIQLLMC